MVMAALIAPTWADDHPFGSLATMLVLAFARRDGVEVRAGRLVMLGLWPCPHRAAHHPDPGAQLRPCRLRGNSVKPGESPAQARRVAGRSPVI